MNQLEWRTFLADWQNEARQLVAAIPQSLLDTNQEGGFRTDLICHGADESLIAAGQTRVGLDFPQDLADFYRASNGWHQLGFDEYDVDIRSVETLSWLGDEQAALVDAIRSYESDEKDGPFSSKDLGSLIVLSMPCANGAYLLNLAGYSTTNRYSCLVIRYKSAPRRFRSFSELMVAERCRCLDAVRELQT